MPSRPLRLDDLAGEERIELMGHLWNSLDPAAAAPITEALEAELDRRETEADAEPENGESWPGMKEALANKLR